jgi:hypothetical protein
VSDWIRARPNKLKANQAYFQQPAIARLPVFLMGPYDNYSQWFIFIGVATGGMLAFRRAWAPPTPPQSKTRLHPNSQPVCPPLPPPPRAHTLSPHPTTAVFKDMLNGTNKYEAS